MGDEDGDPEGKDWKTLALCSTALALRVAMLLLRSSSLTDGPFLWLLAGEEVLHLDEAEESLDVSWSCGRWWGSGVGPSERLQESDPIPSLESPSSPDLSWSAASMDLRCIPVNEVRVRSVGLINSGVFAIVSGD